MGAHTVSHVFLAAQTEETQRCEIIGSKEQLEQILERPVTSFAYPYGGTDSISPQTVKIVREAGFQIACANTPGLVNARSDPFLLPRCLVRNWPGKEFARRLRSFYAE